MSVRYADSALADLAAILAYLEERSISGGRNVMRSIRKTADLIGDYPGLGRLAGESTVRVTRAGRYPYLVYWDVVAGVPIIVHIRHAARRPWPESDR